MAFYPKSMIKKLQPGIDLLSGDFAGFEGLFRNAMEKLFRKGLKLDDSKGTPPDDGRVQNTRPTPADIVLLQTRNNQVIALTKADFDLGNYSNVVTVSNSVTADPEKEPDIKRHYSRPYLDDYQRGFYDRYMFFDIRTKRVKEVSERDYIKYRDLRYKRTTVISWYILGEADDYQLEGYIYPGVENNNKDVLIQAESIIPGITEFFKNYRGFTEHLLSDISEYDGAVEVIEPLEDPPPPPTEEEIEEEEDLTPTDLVAELPDPPNMDLLDDLASGLISASAGLDDIDDLVESVEEQQDQITSELEDEIADTESRIQALEDDQERQERINAIKMIIDVDEMNMSQSIINWSSKARRKKKRRRLDQERDEKKIKTLVGIVLNGSTYPAIYTAQETVIAANGSSLRSRVRLNLVQLGSNKQRIDARWSRNNFDDPANGYASSKSAKNGVYTATGEHARLYDDPSPAATNPNSNADSTDYSQVTLTTRQRDAALSALTARERNQVPNLREVVINMMKDEVLASQQESTTFKIRKARTSVRRRFAAYKEANAGNTEWSKRGGDDGGDFTEGAVDAPAAEQSTYSNDSGTSMSDDTSSTPRSGGRRGRGNTPVRAGKERRRRGGRVTGSSAPKGRRGRQRGGGAVISGKARGGSNYSDG
tara:strand:- start:3236 stop:5194 length:1959 start_codon:yes stop_codon:yes gene_type:complete